jgi:mannose/cellobiose epimerase-like protein (N-acyl-D-glucosamine 2-epimerase family)
MPDKARIEELLQSTESYLTGALLPFWVERSPDRDAGGFLTYFDPEGRPTGKTTKTFLMQIRMLYTMASAHRAGYGGGRCGELARMGADFILEHYWDEERDGWVWIADRHGRTTNADKVGYGQCFGVYAFSEYALATGDPRGREAAERSYCAICRHMADTRHGGFMEIMRPDWRPERPGKYGGDRKSMDVHLHMMEALTRLYELTGSPTHRRRLLEIIDLICTRMLDPQTGLGYMQFSFDFTPLPAILFATEWGSDEQPEDGVAHPLQYTSYGHNVEFAWLLLHAADVLGVRRADYANVVRPIFDHCVQFGIDPQYGGVYIDGPFGAPPAIRHKQFWQQAETLIGMLDAYALFGEERYWRAFESVYRFVFDKFVNLDAGGEWRALLDRDGTPIWDYLGHEWKISYHTVRSTIQVISRLRSLAEAE